MAEPVAEANEQAALLDDYVEETSEYYIICDGCRGCFDQETYGVGQKLYDQGWRVAENERGREQALCPKCAAPAPELQEE